MSVKFNAVVKELRDRSAYYGLYSRVARRLGVSPQHVRRVAMGLGTSKRVSRELAVEVKQIAAGLRRRRLVA